MSVTRSIRGKSNHGSIARQPCRCYLKGTSTRTLCEYWHPPECQFYKNATGCKAGDKCLFPHYKVDEQPNKEQKKSNIPNRRESDDKNAVAFVQSVSQLGCVSQDSDALVSQGRKARGNPMQKVLEPIERVRFTKSTLRHASGHRWEKQMSFLTSEVPTLWNLRTGPMKRLNDSSDVPEAILGILPKIYTSSKRTTGLHSTFSRRIGYSRLRQEKSRRKEILWLIQERVCMWSVRKTSTLLSWRP